MNDWYESGGKSSHFYLKMKKNKTRQKKNKKQTGTIRSLVKVLKNEKEVTNDNKINHKLFTFL